MVDFEHATIQAAAEESEEWRALVEVLEHNQELFEDFWDAVYNVVEY